MADWLQIQQIKSHYLQGSFASTLSETKFDINGKYVFSLQKLHGIEKFNNNFFTYLLIQQLQCPCIVFIEDKFDFQAF